MMKVAPIDEMVMDFYDQLFGQIFNEPFQTKIKESRKKRRVSRDVTIASEAASQSMYRFFVYGKLTKKEVRQVLEGFEPFLI